VKQYIFCTNVITFVQKKINKLWCTAMHNTPRPYSLGDVTHRYFIALAELYWSRA